MLRETRRASDRPQWQDKGAQLQGNDLEHWNANTLLPLIRHQTPSRDSTLDEQELGKLEYCH
jgi:hypothetical protein